MTISCLSLLKAGTKRRLGNRLGKLNPAYAGGVDVVHYAHFFPENLATIQVKLLGETYSDFNGIQRLSGRKQDQRDYQWRREMTQGILDQET